MKHQYCVVYQHVSRNSKQDVVRGYVLTPERDMF